MEEAFHIFPKEVHFRFQSHTVGCGHQTDESEWLCKIYSTSRGEGVQEISNTFQVTLECMVVFEFCLCRVD